MATALTNYAGGWTLYSLSDNKAFRQPLQGASHLLLFSFGAEKLIAERESITLGDPSSDGSPAGKQIASKLSIAAAMSN